MKTRCIEPPLARASRLHRVAFSPPDAAILPRLSAPQEIALRAPDGPDLAGLLWSTPPGAPGVLVVHGLGSRKENHADFAALAAGAGMAALAVDLRGHGASRGELDGGVLDDVIAGLGELEARGHAPLGVRGSSLGGLLALHAARIDRRVRAAVAICPAQPERLAEGLGRDWPRAVSPEPPSRPDGVARGYWHATGDDHVPWSATFALATRTPPPVRLRIVLGGGHRTLQHDPAVLADTVGFLAGHLGVGQLAHRWAAD
jgi:dienelactone hydrolase